MAMPTSLVIPIMAIDNFDMTASVVLATCNGASHLREQLDSLSAQSRMPDELIISDDASTDETVEILTEFARRTTLKLDIVVHTERVGYGRNFMAATENATGDIVLFCDQDDIWHPAKIDLVVNRMSDDRADLVLHDMAVIFESGRPEIPSYYDHLENCGFPVALCFKGCTMAVRRGFIQRYGWPSSRSTMSHDFWLIGLATALGRIGRIGRPLIKHRIHARNTSGWLLESNSWKPKEWAQGVPGTLDTILDLCISPWNVQWLDELASVVSAQDDPRLDAFRSMLRHRADRYRSIDA